MDEEKCWIRFGAVVRWLVFIGIFVAAGVFHFSQIRKGDESFGWDVGDLKVSEREYYTGRIEEISDNWNMERRQAERTDEGRFEDSYNTILVVDTEKPAMWLERGGQVDVENYTDLPKGMKWRTMWYSPNLTKRLAPVARFKSRGYYSDRQTREKIIVMCEGCGGHLTLNIDSGYINTGYGTGIGRMAPVAWPEEEQNEEDYGSIVVGDEEYAQIVAAATAGDASSALESPWRRMDKRIYGEIERQIKLAGYELRKLEMYVGADGESARAETESRSERSRFGFSPSYRRATCLKIEYLADDIWYVKSAPGVGRWSRSGEVHHDLEFVVYAEDKLNKFGIKEWINKGRAEHRIVERPASEFKATLPNGVVIELLGVCKSPSIGRQWWAADGEAVDYEPHYYAEPNRGTSSGETYEIAWRYYWPSNTTHSRIERVFDGRSTSRSGRGGTHGAEELAVHKFNCRENTEDVDLKFLITLNKEQQAHGVVFKSISLRPGEDKGIAIEPVEDEEAKD